MCGIAGWLDYNNNLTTKENRGILREMQSVLARRGPDAGGEYIEKNVGLVHRRLAVVDIEGGKQPMTRGDYTIVYNGELYNTPELRAELLNKGYTFQGNCDTEVLLNAYIEWGAKCLDKLNGIFAFAVWDKKSLFCARDPMGVKPFFFKQIQSGIVFASEIKSLFRNPLCPAKIDKKGLNEIFLLSPGRIPGGAVYKDIKELRPGEYLVADKKGIRKKQYFKIMARPHTEDYNETKTHLRELVTDSIKRQLVSDVPLACFLSGGLDSSLISYIKSTSGTNTETFSVDFVDNDKNFTRNDFQPDTDTKYINIMKDFAKTDHKFVTLENDKVVAALREAALARDLPGMADVDASLLLFCGEVKKTHTVCLSGECADELFGGYPWYFTPQDPNTFPWSRSLEMRKNLLNKKYLTKSPEQFVKKLIDETAKKTSVLESDFESDKAARRMFMLNVQWFMQTLLDRKDRMSMYNGLEVRVPFCDKRLVEYAFNIPWSLKSLNGREKGLLREAFRGILPDEIVLRKKSPYPKTFDPEFLKSVRDLATQAVNRGGLVSQIINKEYFDMLRNLEYESSGGASPWYGQLMRLPQVYAWIYQMDVIFNEYNVKLV